VLFRSFIEVLKGVQDKAADLGVELMLYGVNNPVEAEHFLRRSLHRGRVDGVLFFSMGFPESCVGKFREMHLPLVLVDAYHPQFDSLRVKNREGAQHATSHLIQLGHREIAMINGTLETQPAQERLAGYKDALEGFGLQFSMDKVRVAPRGKQDGFNKEWGRTAMRDLIRTMTAVHPLTAVFVASDVQAIGAIEAAHELGVKIPDDIALVGFDDIELAQHLGITTMRQPMYEMGTLALERLLSRMNDPSAPVSLSTFMPELIIRSSCGARQNTKFRYHEQSTQIQLADSGV
jgi:LacI family transcriptional regulator